MFNKRIFLDYASTTPVDKEVFNKMKKYFSDNFANCQSIHSEGVKNKKILDDSRKRVARLVQAKEDEVIFTGGGTESNNLAIIGLVEYYLNKFKETGSDKKPHIITTKIEHVAVLESVNALSKKGVEVTYLNVDEEGLIKPEQLFKEIKENTVLISVMLANNEIGTVLPVRDVSRQILKYKKKNNINSDSFPYLHTDASQAPNYLDININRLGIDLMSLDGSKIYGPKGVGVLVKKKYVEINNISFGGSQEFGYRAGTENLPLIVGFTEALEKCTKIKDSESKRLKELQKYFIDELEGLNKKIKINGSTNKRLPNNINFCVENLNSEFAVIQLDEMGIACSAMTACRNMSEVANSYVVESIDSDCGKSSLRFTMGRDTKKKDITKTVEALSKILK